MKSSDAQASALPLTGFRGWLAELESPAFLWSFLYFFLLLTAYYVLRPVRDALGSTQNLQWLFSGTFVVMLLLQPIYGALVSRFPRRVFLPVVYAVFIACLGFFYWAFHYDFGWRSAAFFIWVAVFNLFAVSVFWSYMADVFRNEDARRLYGYIGVGGTLGGFLGPIITRSLVNQVGVANLLLVSASLLTLCLLCIVKLAPFARAREIERNGHDDEQAMGGSILAGLRLIWQRPLLRAMAALMFFGVGVGTLLYNEQAAIARTAFDTAEARTSYYAMIDLAINLTTISVQMLLTRYLLLRFGIAPLLLIPAGLILLGYCILAAAPLPMLVAIVQVLTRSGEFSLAKPARETVYTRVDRESRYKAKAVIDTVVYRGGDVVFVWTHKLLASFGSLSVFLGGATLAAGLAFSAWQLVRLQRKPLPEESSAPGADLLTARHP
ncbi:MAG TPA: MFS transporter [Aquimonas sp.]|jgi:AAA family ATP:ADP antiporter|nr:MFS transporter [Xanthomonadales bacterium]HRD73424.1 MFS transporter [Aquimonas sp.]HRF55169.1 MFS transporter [Aquimonas sp.]